MGGQDSANVDVVEHVQMLLQTVFSLFARVSLQAESEENRFPL